MGDVLREVGPSAKVIACITTNNYSGPQHKKTGMPDEFSPSLMQRESIGGSQSV